MNNTKVPHFFGLLLDFLFPAGESVKTFENVSVDEFKRRLPPSEPINENVAAVFAYSDERVKHLVWEIKYYRNTKIADAVGSLIAEKMIGGKISAEKFGWKTSDWQFLVVPIPLTSRRLRERGFNHTELIAKSVLKNLPRNLRVNFALAPEILRKIRHTPKQSSIENREKRFQNIVGAFEVAEPHLVAGKNIVVIDDVITTGATVSEAKRALFEAGAKSVRAFAVAH